MKQKTTFTLDFIQRPRLLIIMLHKRYALVSRLTKSLTGSDGGIEGVNFPTADEKLGNIFRV